MNGFEMLKYENNFLLLHSRICILFLTVHTIKHYRCFVFKQNHKIITFIEVFTKYLTILLVFISTYFSISYVWKKSTWYWNNILRRFSRVPQAGVGLLSFLCPDLPLAVRSRTGGGSCFEVENLNREFARARCILYCRS